MLLLLQINLISPMLTLRCTHMSNSLIIFVVFHFFTNFNTTLFIIGLKYCYASRRRRWFISSFPLDYCIVSWKVGYDCRVSGDRVVGSRVSSYSCVGLKVSKALKFSDLQPFFDMVAKLSAIVLILL